MKTRLIAAYLWIAALWSLGAVAHEAIGVSEYLGLGFGLITAFAVLIVPADLWHRRVTLGTAEHSAPETAFPSFAGER
ncbi:MAG TPA: hypothetical protein VFK38_09670 [Candidatus Limnocylindrales bacterium]|nr:hypothetical protein [Candidatus Limnocylindrales bacterium]